jgi:ATP:ADP antiporter, AAA family
MTTETDSNPPTSGLDGWMQRLFSIPPVEAQRALLSFGYFFAVLCAYYIVRPIRETMGITLNDGRKGSLEWMFTLVFLVMLLAVPAMGYVVARFPRRRIVPIIYGFFIFNLLVFWTMLGQATSNKWIAGAFFVWVSVFNLFAISLFWSVMSDTWESAQAKRLYGFISAGGSVGGLVGSSIAQGLVTTVGTPALLWFSAAALGLALACYSGLSRLHAANAATAAPAEDLSFATLVSGATRVWHNPLLFRIAMVILLANLVSTFFYFEQARIVGDAIKDRDLQTQLFARMNWVQNAATIATEFFATNRLIAALGLGLSVAMVGILAVIGLCGIAVWPALWLIVSLIVFERVVAFALSNPAKRVLYTDIPPEDKYKSQNFIDTVVFRGGDAAAGWVVGGLGKGLGIASHWLALLMVPAAIAWAALAWKLGRDHDARHADGAHANDKSR